MLPVRTLRVIAWVPLALCVGIAIYVVATQPADTPTDVVTFFRTSIEALLHGHVPIFFILALVGAFASIGCAVPIILHIAQNPAIPSKGAWIVGALLLAPILLPIYATKHLARTPS